MAEWRKPALALGDWGPTASNNCQPKNIIETLLGPIGVKAMRCDGAIAQSDLHINRIQDTWCLRLGY